MNTIVELTGVALAALLAENFVLVSCMGIGTHTRAFEDPIDSLRTGYCLTLVMVLGTFFTWCIDNWIFANHNGQHFRLFVFALFLPAMVWLIRKFLHLCIPELSRRIDGHLASIATNCAALGCALLVSRRSYDLITALTFALFGGIGVTVAHAINYRRFDGNVSNRLLRSALHLKEKARSSIKLSFEPFSLLACLKRRAFSTLALGGRGAVTAAHLDRLQRAAVLFGVVVGAAVDAALDAGVKSLLVHTKTSSI